MKKSVKVTLIIVGVVLALFLAVTFSLVIEGIPPIHDSRTPAFHLRTFVLHIEAPIGRLESELHHICSTTEDSHNNSRIPEQSSQYERYSQDV